MTITNTDQSAFPHPDRSELRKMSAKIVISSQIQMKNRKKYNIDRNTCPVPNTATIGLSLSLDRRFTAPSCTEPFGSPPLSLRRVGGASPEPGDGCQPSE